MKQIVWAADEARAPRWRAPLIALGAYAGAVLTFAWPLPLHLADQAVLARGSDFYPHIWNLWWMRWALFTQHTNPYVTTYLNYPTGLPLTYHVLDPLDGLASLPLQASVGLLAAFNLLRLAQLVFAAGAACALARLLRLPWQAAWAAGALFVFCPIVGTSFDLGQLVEISVGWLPLTILCLIKGLGNRALGLAPGGWRWLVGAGLALAAAALATWYFFTTLALFTGLYVLWELAGFWILDFGFWIRRGFNTEIQNPKSKIQNLPEAAGLIGRAALLGGIAVAVLNPLILALLRESASGADYMFPSLETIIANSADLLSFFLPLPAHVVDPVINPHGGNPALGWTALILAGVGLVGGDRVGRPPLRTRPAFWAAVGGGFAVLALGPHLLVGGRDTGLVMPYRLLDLLPFVGAARVPVRFVVMVSLAVALLAGYGLAALDRRMLSAWAQRGLYVGLLALIAIEFVNVPRTLFRPAAHPFFATIAAPGGVGAHDAVLELPQGDWTAPAMWDQTVHQRPILGGYTARHYPYPWLRATPGVAQLAAPDLPEVDAPDIISPTVQTVALAALDYYGVRYVAVHPLPAGGAGAKIQHALAAIFGAHRVDPIFQDRALTVYQVPPQPAPGPFVGLGDGWYQLEGDPGAYRRWTNGAAQVELTNPAPTPVRVTLHLAVFSVNQPRHLVVTLDGREVLRQPIGLPPAQPVDLSLDVAPGLHWLTLGSLEAPIAPPGDRRLLALAFTQVAVTSDQ